MLAMFALKPPDARLCPANHAGGMQVGFQTWYEGADEKYIKKCKCATLPCLAD